MTKIVFALLMATLMLVLVVMGAQELPASVLEIRQQLGLDQPIGQVSLGKVLGLILLLLVVFK